MNSLERYYIVKGEVAFVNCKQLTIDYCKFNPMGRIFPTEFIENFANRLVDTGKVREIEWLVFGGFDIDIISEAIACEIWPNLKVWKIVGIKGYLELFNLFDIIDNNKSIAEFCVSHDELRKSLVSENYFGLGRDGCL